MNLRIALALVFAVSVVAGSGCVARAKPSAAHRCRHMATIQNAGLLALCRTIGAYVDGRHQWDPAAARLEAQYGADPVTVSPAGRAAWVKLTSRLVKLEQPIADTCPKASAMRAHLPKKEAASFVLMCKTTLDILTGYRLFYAMFSHHRQATDAELQRERNALADAARNRLQVVAVLSDESLVG